jgi:hypothetical protein
LEERWAASAEQRVPEQALPEQVPLEVSGETEPGAERRQAVPTGRVADPGFAGHRGPAGRYPPGVVRLAQCAAPVMAQGAPLAGRPAEQQGEPAYLEPVANVGARQGLVREESVRVPGRRDAAGVQGHLPGAAHAQQVPGSGEMVNPAPPGVQPEGAAHD